MGNHRVRIRFERFNCKHQSRVILKLKRLDYCSRFPLKLARSIFHRMARMEVFELLECG